MREIHRKKSYLFNILDHEIGNGNILDNFKSVIFDRLEEIEDEYITRDEIVDFENSYEGVKILLTEDGRFQLVLIKNNEKIPVYLASLRFFEDNLYKTDDEDEYVWDGRHESIIPFYERFGQRYISDEVLKEERYKFPLYSSKDIKKHREKYKGGINYVFGDKRTGNIEKKWMDYNFIDCIPDDEFKNGRMYF